MIRQVYFNLVDDLVPTNYFSAFQAAWDGAGGHSWSASNPIFKPTRVTLLFVGTGVCELSFGFNDPGPKEPLLFSGYLSPNVPVVIEGQPLNYNLTTPTYRGFNHIWAAADGQLWVKVEGDVVGAADPWTPP